LDGVARETGGESRCGAGGTEIRIIIMVIAAVWALPRPFDGWACQDDDDDDEEEHPSSVARAVGAPKKLHRVRGIHESQLPGIIFLM
jgi:hypothetical protein